MLLMAPAVMISGCSRPWGQPAVVQYENDAVRGLMDQLGAANAGLEVIKGRGRVRITTPGAESLYDRTVWVGAQPGRLRFAFLAPTGMPIFSMSCDEQWVTALRHGDGEYYRRQVGNNSLTGFLPIEINCADLFGLLVGRPPGVAYDAVRIDHDATHGHEDIVMLLQRRFGGTVGRLRVARDSGELQTVELLDVHGNRRYEARLEDMQTVDGYRLPTRIHLSGPDGGLELEVGRIWLETGVADDTFQIEAPRSN